MSDLLPSDLADHPESTVSTPTGCGRPAPAPKPPEAGSIWPHVLALSVVLAALVPVAGLGSVWSADEGALLYQATAVAEGRGWTFDHPFPEADPTGRWYPIHLSGFAADGGYVVLGKHTVLVRLAGLAHRLGGYGAVVALSVAGAIAAAAATARLTSRVDRRSAAPALWLAGTASPLLLGAYVAWAHTLAAALVGWGLVGLTTEWPAGRTNERTWSWPWPWLAGAGALGAACLLRTEATLAAGAATLALALPLGRARGRAAPTLSEAPGGARWVDAALPPALAGIGTAIGYGLDRTTAIERTGPVVPPGDRWGGLAGRLDGFLHTWLRPDFSSDPEHLLLLASATAVICAGIVARRDPGDPRRDPGDPGRVLGLLGLAVGFLSARALISPVALIPGLVVAFPVLFTGLALTRRPDLDRPTGPALGTFVALFWGAVLATQYRYGGGGEWGGRYFALGLPAALALATPPLVRAIDQFGHHLDDRPTDPFGHRNRRLLLASGAVITLLPVTMGILGLRHSRAGTEAITGRVDAALVDPGDGSDRPVVVTTMAPLGRWAWSDLDRSRWLLVQDVADLPEVAERLHSLGVKRLVFATQNAADELDPLAAWFVPIGPLDTDPTTNLDEIVIPLQAIGEVG